MAIDVIVALTKHYKLRVALGDVGATSTVYLRSIHIDRCVDSYRQHCDGMWLSVDGLFYV